MPQEAKSLATSRWWQLVNDGSGDVVRHDLLSPSQVLAKVKEQQGGGDMAKDVLLFSVLFLFTIMGVFLFAYFIPNCAFDRYCTRCDEWLQRRHGYQRQNVVRYV